MIKVDCEWTDTVSQESEQRFRSLIETVAHLIVILDETGVFCYCSPSVQNVLGYQPEEVEGRSATELVHPTDIASILPMLQSAIRQPRVDQPAIACRIRHRDGFWRCFEAVATSLLDDPAVGGVVVNCHDITERQQAQAELLEMSTALGNAVEGIARLDVQSCYIALNRAYSAMLGYQQAEMIGMSWQQTVHPDDLPIAKATYYQMLLEGKSKAEVRAVRKNGSIFYKEVMIVAAYDWYAQFIGHHCFIRDITERTELYRQVHQLNVDLECQVQERTTQLQQALHYEAMLKRITDSVRDSLDESQILQSVVQELTLGLEALGCDVALYSLDRSQSTICYEYLFEEIPPAQGAVISIESLGDDYFQLLRGEAFQFCVITPDPARPIEKRFAILACPIVEEQNVLGDLWLFRLREDTFSPLEVRLVQQVANQCAIAIRQARLHQAIQAQVAALEELNQLKDDFLSMVSHELRTPMSNMKMAIHMMRNINTPERQKQYLDILQSECNREIELINDLLDLQRLEAASYSLAPSVIDVQKCLLNLVQPFQSRVQERQQTLTVNMPFNVFPITTDQSTLERVLAELLNNACKYTPPGDSITLSVQQSEGALNHPSQITFTVCNQADIPESELSRIFDKFYRVPNGDRWKQGGTGLGLALVQRLVAELGGTIRVESENGWTTFTVQLGCSNLPPTRSE